MHGSSEHSELYDPKVFINSGFKDTTTAMMTMTNEQLTANLSDLANRVQGQANRLEAFMPEIRDKVLQGEAQIN